jgi:hypothetical protein
MRKWEPLGTYPENEERDEYADAPEIEWDTPISDDELAERLAWFWMPKEEEQ